MTAFHLFGVCDNMKSCWLCCCGDEFQRYISTSMERKFSRTSDEFEPNRSSSVLEFVVHDKDVHAVVEPFVLTGSFDELQYTFRRTFINDFESRNLPTTSLYGIIDRSC
ncbi:hypothetical protein GCK72_018536 [Caenorhabditis remanei]|uniref:Uncharacterized protein n=1 Tax=Caenorhabditis remanei TaxID=31234 RepID=A0A6A5GC29_CAERE|nr:hypothetical protein GCK72_018536 [Caenorhabditis remanei]KAF1751982.1 hypothetical protein GCK72_018536 [Caenorhabditis remanei]